MNIPPGLFSNQPLSSGTETAPQPDQAPVINWRICLICFAINLAIILSSLFLMIGLHIEHPDDMKQVNRAQLAVMAILLAPLAETYLFFQLPYQLVRKFLPFPKLVWGVSFLITLSLFIYEHHGGSPHGLHRDWPLAFLVGGVGGATFFSCFYFTHRSGYGSPFWTTTLCHLFYNTCITLITLFP